MITYFLTLVLTAASHASPPPPPACKYYPQECQGRVAEISSAFEFARPLGPAPFLGSGECYHLSPNYNSQTTHYGLLLLDERNGETYMDGKFGFFFPENPYRDWNLERARAESPRRFEENHHVTRESDYAFVDMNPGGQEFVQYWLRQSGQTVFLLGEWGTSQMFYCEFHPQ